MFEKLLAVLPYNPGLMHQMSFYSHRMREEASIRRIGMVFIVLAFFVQFFAVLSPPKATSAASDPSNDIIRGGISSRKDAVDKCENNHQNFKKILDFYGISCSDLKTGNETNIKVGEENYYSMGRHPYYVPNEEKVEGLPDPVYIRPLKYVALSSSFHVLKIKNINGRVYFIMFDCGNLVSIGTPNHVNPPEPKPEPEPCKWKPNINAKNPNCFNPCPFNKDIPKDSPKCVGPCPYNKNINANSDKCVPPCEYDNSIPSDSPRCVPPCQYNHALPANSPQCFAPCQYNNTIPATSPSCFIPCKYSPTIPATDVNCKPCEKGQNANDNVACLSIHKTASNVTAGIADANDTTANPGDVITYTLFAENSSKADIDQFSFAESMNDVLTYADVVDLHGGTLDAYNNLTWPTQKIEAGATASHQVTVKVKNPIPSTPPTNDNPTGFDLTMTNVYGNTINIKVPGTPVTTVAVATTSLPNTGPGETLFVIALIMITGGYFYSRARLLARESNLAIQEMSGQ